MIHKIVFIVLTLGPMLDAFTPLTTTQQRTMTELQANLVDRRSVFSTVAVTAANALILQKAAYALDRVPADNEIVKEQRQVTGKLDINNAPVANYMQLPGMYPTIAGKIANSGPYDSVKDIYRKVKLSSSEKATVQKYEKVLTATPATGLDVMRGRDPYRDSFNESPQVGAAPLQN
jgi:photosystem II PsbU protein